MLNDSFAGPRDYGSTGAGEAVRAAQFSPGAASGFCTLSLQPSAFGGHSRGAMYYAVYLSYCAVGLFLNYSSFVVIPLYCYYLLLTTPV